MLKQPWNVLAVLFLFYLDCAGAEAELQVRRAITEFWCSVIIIDFDIAAAAVAAVGAADVQYILSRKIPISSSSLSVVGKSLTRLRLCRLPSPQKK